MFVKIQDITSFEPYDAVIIGSGPAGATVAQSFLRRGRKVLVVETGSATVETDVQDSYSVIHGQGHFDSNYWPQHWIRALGGTSAVWAGWMKPLSARNMVSWPVTRGELAPWYDHAAVTLGRDPMISTWQSAGVPGFDLKPFSRGNTARYGEAAGEAIWSDTHVHVLLNATISRLHPRHDRTGIERITAFVAPDLDVEIDIAAHQTVVLAAGGMGNAQILLGSTDGTNAAVGNDTDQVGRYLMEHPHFYECATLIVKESFAFTTPPPSFGRFVPALVPDDATHAAAGGVDASFELAEIPLTPEDDLQSLIVERLGGQAKAYVLNARTEMRADPSNRVERIFGTDPSGLPRLRATCIFNADDYRSVLHYLNALGKSVADQDIGRVGIINDHLFSNVTGGGHTMGTTRMGSDPKTSVVDKDCRVHGYSNLFIAGSSVFTTGGYSNPTMTIVALAARLGEFLGGKA